MGIKNKRTDEQTTDTQADKHTGDENSLLIPLTLGDLNTSFVNKMKKRLKIIFNPVSGRGLSDKALQKIIQYFENYDYLLDLLKTAKRGDAFQGANDIDDNLSAIVAIGGDGTINEIVNGLHDKNIPIGIIPIGTGNRLAKELGIPRVLAKACHVIHKAKVFSMDIGYNCRRRFFLMAGIGIDAEVIRLMDTIRHGNITIVDYSRPIIRTIIDYAFPKISVIVDGRMIEEDARFVFIGNGQGYFGPIRFTYLARVNDGNFDICIMKGRHRFHIPKYIIGAFTRTLRSFSDVIYLRGKDVIVTSDSKVSYQLDGDAGGLLPASFHLIPNAVRFLIP